jgi:hypothetical protein
MRRAILVVFGSMLVVQAAEPRPSPVPAELKRLAEWSVKDLVALREGIDAMLVERLTKPSREHVATVAGMPDVDVARIVQRGLLSGVKEPRGGGAYFSFTTKSHSYNEKPDIELQNGYFTSGFAGGDFGMVYSVDARSVADVTEKHYPGLFKLDPREFYKQGRGIRQKPNAEKGVVYVIRSIRWGSTDLIAAFEVLDVDAYTVTFAWRLMRKNAVGSRR